MTGLTHIPEQKRLLLEGFVSRLSAVEGMAAIVLGGSYASGAFHDASDLDVGLYYFEATPFAIAEIRRIAEEVSIQERVTVTDFYGWGAWVNGGAWIHTRHGKVDFLYRNLDQIQRTIDEARQGIFRHDHGQQPAYGFYSVIYLAETQVCIPLFDPRHLLRDLKRQVEVYPPRLKETIVRDCLWSAEFTLLHARGFAAQGDVYNTAGCLTRAASSLTQVLFALNETYFMRDKQVMNVIAGFSICPSGYVAEIGRILASPGSDRETLAETVARMERAWQDVVALTGGRYQPAFQM
jgi:predicted nucleotidyltransferase